MAHYDVRAVAAAKIRRAKPIRIIRPTMACVRQVHRARIGWYCSLCQSGIVARRLCRCCSKPGRKPPSSDYAGFPRAAVTKRLSPAFNGGALVLEAGITIGTNRPQGGGRGSKLVEGRRLLHGGVAGVADPMRAAHQAVRACTDTSG